MKLVLSPAAIEDLQSISNYTFDVWGEEQEALYLQRLWEKMEEIGENPKIHPLRNDLNISCRSVRHGKHLIFFSSEKDHIAVIRILHSAMDILSHLRGTLL